MESQRLTHSLLSCNQPLIFAANLAVCPVGILPENVIATGRTASIVRPVKWNWKWLQGAAVVATLVLGTGCSGIHASKSVSPATFLLPGLLKNDAPVPQDSMPPTGPVELLAQN